MAIPWVAIFFVIYYTENISYLINVLTANSKFLKRILVYFLSSVFIFLLVWTVGAMPAHRDDTVPPDAHLVALSGELLYAVKTGEPTDSIETALAAIPKQTLIHGLSNDNARKTFWINIYNAYFQILASREKLTRPDIFTKNAFTIGGIEMSLDDVEHGILRRYRVKWSLGYLPRFWPPKDIKKLAVSTIDYRIHFALNCGAKSCPPIAFYEYNKLETQLELAATSFLTQDVEVDEAQHIVHVTKIMQWFKADFEGSRGIKKILAKYLGKDFSDYSIEYKDYNWDDSLGNYAE